jgi:hypothetical protein
MENLLCLYARPYDPAYPVVCVDESGKELSERLRSNLPLAPGQPLRVDSEYKRYGMRNLFMAVEPKRGWRHVEVTAQRTAKDYAHFIRWVVEEVYSEAVEIQIVQDNLNTHTPGALYKTFGAAQARKILERVRFHYTPVHGSWLNMAEIEIGIFKRQCLDRRMGDEEFLINEVAALEAERNRQEITIEWQFTCEKARETFARFYAKLITT